jgi:hypothetical protein
MRDYIAEATENILRGCGLKEFRSFNSDRHIKGFS